jgi:ribonuclease P protein component
VTRHAFPKSLRLLVANDFQAVFDNAPFRASHQHLLILARANHTNLPRLGLVIAKKHVRFAVQRNRIKRLIRESFRHQQESLAGLDVIVLARKGMGELTNADITAQLNQQLQRVLRKARQMKLENTENGS